MEKVKKISKYVMNILAMINALLVGLAPIWGWNIDKVAETIIVINGVVGVYLVGGKLWDLKKEHEVLVLTEKIGDDND